MNNKALRKEQVEKVDVINIDINVDNTYRQSVNEKVTNNTGTFALEQEHDKKTDNTINHVTEDDESVDTHPVNDVQTSNDVSAECLSYSKRLSSTNDNMIEERDIINGEHTDLHDIYSDSYMKIVVSTSVDIYASLKYETIPEVRNRIIGIGILVKKLKNKVSLSEERIVEFMTKDVQMLKIKDQMNTLLIKNDKYRSEIKKCEDKITHFGELIKVAEESNRYAVQIYNTDEFTMYHSIYKIKSEINRKNKKITKLEKELAHFTTVKYDESVSLNYKITYLRYNVSKLKLLELYFSKEENDIKMSVPISNQKIEYIQEQKLYCNSKLKFLENQNTSASINKSMIESSIQDYKERIELHDLEICVIRSHHALHSDKDLTFEIEHAKLYYKLDNLTSQADTLIADIGKKTIDTKKMTSTLNQYDTDIKYLQQKITLMEINNRFETIYLNNI